MLKVLFLDLDGVMVTDRDWQPLGWDHGPFDTELFDPECVKVLNRVLRETDAQVVLSSDWRLHLSLTQMWDVFKFNQVERMPLGFTGFECEEESRRVPAKRLEEFRGLEVTNWLTQHGFGNQFDFWVAVDDMNLSPHCRRFVRTSWKVGLATPGVEEKLVAMLNGK